uniref:MGS-like domain-containing protein n=1 Tax=Chromera velia CCMP2878 TaxID=1169474 RepID=A0A0G4HG91_9ALVE|mmetsp:Transcript_44395/g.87741  ORF Transcript_44395/g.87741 Transcript_44395/m.87741 type:complete len:617 (+) Transcript_44395:137-1987(+)|eukprot:Cvel_27321.t1-p1 / transcript=Cvel_27321.t1 / gene=Cvel_27321 / organism=Chromera_velia_CCMP2878 / gene_product=Bifunctional purine biosynthesis protein PURH, putative / transcript_product=Bifunctional purine biosynthesis protein PURH, putative / location=Cvel_scaffold3388:9507-11752(-) / protein_length=616 / sequence_SO=supercontig / SO=protein_coding / is_pseudo=false
MSHSHHAAISGSNVTRKVERALISVFDKTGLEDIGLFLKKFNVHILSTGGSAKKLAEAGCEVTEVASYTGSPEVFDGRVKTLHPKIHGGILAVRGNDKHEAEMKSHDIGPIDLVIVNLYPFEETVRSGADFPTCIENIDIGGPAMIRASAKNNAAVAIVTSASQYDMLKEAMTATGGCTTPELRKRLAGEAYARTAAYDGAIAKYFAGSLTQDNPDYKPVNFPNVYLPMRPLKYGCNPQQAPASLCSLGSNPLPFSVLNGTPGYINLLDAINAWQLVHELKKATGRAAAASFKHVSPAGAAIAKELTAHERAVFDIGDKPLTPSAQAYVRARNADPLCSFGDFAALSDEVDEATAMVLKVEVSDGIIAPGFDPAALEILKAKKNGAFIVLQADPTYAAPDLEFRDIGGVGFMQRRNAALFDESKLENVVTKNKDLPAEAKADLILASVTVKYTQSNSVGYALNGQMIGVGAGQQSRVDCVKLAGRKVTTWFMRQHPKVMGLKFKEGVKRQERVNARVRYIEGDMTELERVDFEKLLTEVPKPLTKEEKDAHMKTLTGVAVSSDAFFPFRDNIDHLNRYGVKYVVHPGGSVQDAQVNEAADQYGMVMAHSGLRLFHH